MVEFSTPVSKDLKNYYKRPKLLQFLFFQTPRKSSYEMVLFSVKDPLDVVKTALKSSRRAKEKVETIIEKPQKDIYIIS